MSDDLVGLAAAYILSECYHEGCSENLKRSIRRKAEQLILRDGEVFYMKYKKEASGKKVSNTANSYSL